MKPLLFILACLSLAACAEGAPENPRVVMETPEGAITLELYPEAAPLTVANFLRYVDAGAFDGAHFYRVVRPGNDPLVSAIQGGLWTPWEDGMDPDYEAPFPSIAHETTQMSGLSHEDGVISMARLEPGTANSEFFINVGANPSLDFGGARNPDGQGFAAFGRVVRGMDAVRAIHESAAREGDGFEAQILVNPVIIETVKRKS